MADLRGLIERCEKAVGDDPLLESDLVEHFFGKQEATLHCLHQFRRYELLSSVDAALALVEKVRPGWHVEIYGASGKTAAVKIEGPRTKDGSFWSGNDQPAALAIILALLRSLLNSTEGGEAE